MGINVMKTLLIFLLFTSLALGQLIVDSTAVERVSNDEDWFWGRVSYEGSVPSLSDYTIGFLYGEDRDNINYVPMGWFNHDASAKTITFRTEMGNLPDKKIWVRVAGKNLQYGTATKVQGYEQEQKEEIWSGVFLDGSLLPNGTNGKLGLLLAWEVKTADTEQPDGRPNSTEIDVTITNPDLTETKSDRVEIPQNAIPAT